MHNPVSEHEGLGLHKMSMNFYLEGTPSSKHH